MLKLSYCTLNKWQERRGSNPQPSVLETDTLPIELHSYAVAGVCLTKNVVPQLNLGFKNYQYLHKRFFLANRLIFLPPPYNHYVTNLKRNTMKKTLLSLLTTVAFAAPTFAADGLTHQTNTSPCASKVLSEAIEAELGAIEAELNTPSHRKMAPQVRKVLNGQSDLNATLDNSQWTPASFAAYHGMFSTLKALAQMGSKLVTQEGKSVSTLHSAVNRFSIDQFSELLNLAQQQGFDVNSQDANKSLLYSAVNNSDGPGRKIYPSLMMV